MRPNNVDPRATWPTAFAANEQRPPRATATAGRPRAETAAWPRPTGTTPQPRMTLEVPAGRASATFAPMRGDDGPRPLGMDAFGGASFEAALSAHGPQAVAELTGLAGPELALPADLSPVEQLAHAFRSIEQALEAACWSQGGAAGALGRLLAATRSAYGRGVFAARAASVFAHGSGQAVLLSNNPGGHAAAYLATLWDQGVASVASLAPTTLWPDAGQARAFGPYAIEAQSAEAVPLGEGAPSAVVLRATLRCAGERRPLTVVQVAWPDFGTLPPAALARLASLCERSGGGQRLAIHCQAGLGRSGTLALAHALSALPAPATLGEALLMFLRLRLQRMGAVETDAQFVSAVQARAA